jgi:hypothetical protein
MIFVNGHLAAAGIVAFPPLGLAELAFLGRTLQNGKFQSR